MREKIIKLVHRIIEAEKGCAYFEDDDVEFPKAEAELDRLINLLGVEFGLPAEIPKPETVGCYFVRETGGEHFDVVEVYDAFEELRVSYFMQDRATALNDPRFDGAMWWTCPFPKENALAKS